MMDIGATMMYTEVKENRFKPWIVCFAASLLFFYEFIQGTMFASIADRVMSDFQIEADKMIYLSSAYYLANVIFLFVAGILLDRHSVKKLLVFAMFFCVLSTFILSQTHSFYIAFFCRFIIGVGSAFCFLGPIRIATVWFPPKKMAFVTGAIVTMAMSGGMLAQYPLMTLVMQQGWRDALLEVSLAGVVMWFVMLRWIEDRPAHIPVVPLEKINIWAITKMAYFDSRTILSGSYASLMNMGVAVFGAVMGQLYLIQRLHVEHDTAAIVNGMLFLGAMFGGPCIGLWSDKLGQRILPMRVGALLSFLILLAILYLPSMTIFMMGFLFFALGFTTSSQVISYPLVAERCQPMLVASSLSFVSILLQGGYVVYQNIYSYILMHTGTPQWVNGAPVYSLSAYQSATLILPVGFLVAYLITFLLKDTHGSSHKA